MDIDDAVMRLDSVRAIFGKVPNFYGQAAHDKYFPERVRRAFEKLRRSAIRAFETTMSTDSQALSSECMSAVERLLHGAIQVLETIIHDVSLI